MDNKLKEICARIKDLREFSDYSVEEFAEKLGIDGESYREYEDGINEMPIGLLYNIAGVLQIDPTILLLGSDPSDDKACVTEKESTVKIERRPGYAFSSLALNFNGREMEPMVVEVKEGIKPELVYHPGQEFNYVLEGELRVIVGIKEYYLREGDSIYFNATIPHAEVPMSKTAKFLTVIQK